MSENNIEQRVVITGLGAVTPLGCQVETMWNNLLAGRNSARRIQKFDASGFNVQIACEVSDFNLDDYADIIDRKEAKRMDPLDIYALAVTAQALKQSGLKIDESNWDEIGVIFGSGIGGLLTIDQGYHALFEKGPMRVSPFTGPYMIPNMGPGEVAIKFGARGPNFTVVSACASGSNAVGEAYEMIRRGDAVAMIAGGAESVITPFGLAAFHRTQAMSTRNDDPEHASRPFDAKRDGFIYGEGAGGLILERLDFAKARGAKILAEIVGYAANNDAYHISAPSEGGVGMAKVMTKAIKKAGIQPGQIDYLNAHGTSTVLNDAAETAAIKKVFGEYAYDLPISASKSMLGHLMGAAGGVEAVITVKTIMEGIMHGTINYEYPDPECDLNYLPNGPVKKDVQYALSNSFGFGGHNMTVIFKKYTE
ncbi:MAG: beta-ketoacyl-ACP synthase II [Anaerolineae bacterium]